MVPGERDRLAGGEAMAHDQPTAGRRDSETAGTASADSRAPVSPSNANTTPSPSRRPAVSPSPASPTPLTDSARLLENYLRHLQQGRQLSSHTLQAYRRDLIEFVAFLDRHIGDTDWGWDGVDRLALRAFLGHLARRGLARRSI